MFIYIPNMVMLFAYLHNTLLFHQEHNRTEQKRSCHGGAGDLNARGRLGNESGNKDGSFLASLKVHKHLPVVIFKAWSPVGCA